MHMSSRWAVVLTMPNVAYTFYDHHIIHRIRKRFQKWLKLWTYKDAKSYIPFSFGHNFWNCDVSYNTKIRMSSIMLQPYEAKLWCYSESKKRHKLPLFMYYWVSSCFLWAQTPCALPCRTWYIRGVWLSRSNNWWFKMPFMWLLKEKLWTPYNGSFTYLSII
jgi:hypothetical protein